MADMDVDQLISEFGKNYPQWVNSAIGPRLDSMVKSLNKLAGTTGSAASDNKKQKDRNKLIDDGNKELGKFTKSMEKVQKGLGAMGKATLNVTKSLGKGDLTGAVDNLTDGMSSLTKGSKGLMGGFGMASAAILGFGAATNFAIKEMQKTRAAYAAMAEQGIFVKDGFVGLRKAAHQGNMTIEQMNLAVSKTTQSILAMGPTGTAMFARLSKAMTHPERLAAKLGMNLGNVNDFLADNLELQRTSGMISRLNDRQRSIAAEKQLKEVTLYSAVLGKSRKQIMDEAQNALKDPQAQNMMYVLSQRMGEGAEVFRENVQKMAMEMTSMTKDPALAKKMTDMALAMYGEQMGVPIIDPAMKAFIEHFKNQSPELARKIADTVGNITIPDATGENVKKSAIELGETFQKAAGGLNHNLGRIVMQYSSNAEQLADVFKTIYQIDYELRGVKIGENLTNAMDEMSKPIDPVMKMFSEMENTLRTVQTGFSSLVTDLATSSIVRETIGFLNDSMETLKSEGVDGLIDRFGKLIGEIDEFGQIVEDVTGIGATLLTTLLGYKVVKSAVTGGAAVAGAAGTGAGAGMARTALGGLGRAGASVGRSLMRHPALMAAMVGFKALDDIPHEAMASATKDDPELLARLAKENERFKGMHFEGGRHRAGIGAGPKSGEYIEDIGARNTATSKLDWGAVLGHVMKNSGPEKLLYKNLQDTIDGKIPQFASGGVVKGQTLANIAEAGRPEMVMPLDPALHNMAKYNAEQMVDIYGPFSREQNREMIRNLFVHNRKVLDEILTFTLDKFMYAKADVESITSAIQSGASLTDAQLRTVRGMTSSGINVIDTDASGMPTLGGGSNTAGIDGAGGATGSLIASGEGDYGSYNRGVAGDSKGKIDFSKMSIKDIMERQSLRPGNKNRLFAVGKYQVIPSTMRAAIKELGLDPNAKMTPEMQENIYRNYLISKKRPEIKDYITGKSDDKMRALAGFSAEFASIANPYTGRSNYGGVGGNKASISSARTGLSMDAERAQYQEYIKSGMTPDDAWNALSRSKTSGAGSTEKISMRNQNETRNKDIKDSLKKILNHAGVLAGIDGIEVTSGGQTSERNPLMHKKKGGWTGGPRHDHGGAADLKLRVGDRYLDFTNPDDLPIIEKFIEESVKAGVTGVGAGLNYMGKDTFHMGFGSDLAWGKNGKAKNAPAWLEAARRRGVAGRSSFTGFANPASIVEDKYVPNAFGDYPDKGFHSTTPSNKPASSSNEYTMEDVKHVLEKLNRGIDNMSKTFKQGVAGTVV